MFRRRRSEDIDEDIDDLDETAAAEPDEDAEADAAPAPLVRPEGPWDADDAPDDDLARLDLGGLRMPVPDGMEVRLDAQDEAIVAATLVDAASAMQVSAFAAPRTAGIWAEVRAEIATSLRETGGSAEEAPGPFGGELHARVPTEVPGQGVVLQHARFIGVDGPRWFVRALLTGPAATDPVQARRLEDAFRAVVVVRGGEAMAPRDALPLRLPRDAMQAAEAAAGDEKRTLDPFHRGPEITEVR